MDHRIEKFMAVVESESFTDAAERLHVSQPALSIAIKNLEKELGAHLIIRGGNFFQVTEEGKLVYEYGVQAKLNLSNLKAVLGSEIASQRTLRIGMIDSIAQLLFGLSAIDIAGKLEARIDNSPRLLRALKLDQLDMAIITKPIGTVGDDYRILEIGEEPFSLVCAPSVAPSAKKMLKRECLIGDFLTYDQSSTTFRWIKKHLDDTRISFTPKFFSTNPELMLQMALAGRGVALLPNSIIEDSLASRKLIRLEGVNYKRSIEVVTLSGKFMSGEMDSIIKTTRICLS